MKRLLSLLGLCSLLSPVALNAQISSVTGAATVVSPPSSTETGTGSESWVFVERSGTLSFDLPVDASKDGSYGNFGAGPLTPGIIPTGTEGFSVYLHSFNSENTSGTTYTGSITFTAPILGVEALGPSLVTTNPLLGAPGTTYYTFDTGQGFELSNQIDQFTISGDTLTYTNETFGAPDDLRILVAGEAPPALTPEPSSLFLLGTGLLALGAATRRKILGSTSHR
jgi:hypothetical protein